MHQFFRSFLVISSLAVSLYAVESATADSSANQLANPGFEDKGAGWNMFGSEIGETAHSGSAALSILNKEVAWSGAEQLIVLPDSARTITLSGWIKTDSVIQGKESWENARISFEFLDENGSMVGGYPPVAGQVVGTTDWTFYTRDYRVHPAARIVKLQVALGNALGKACFDDISLVIKSRKGQILQSGKLSGIMDEGEWVSIDVNNRASGSHFVDWSSLLDAPAGKHGFLQVKGDQFVFEDGTPVRFWGTNLVASDIFAPDSMIDSLVSRLSKMGCNLLRLHHMDAVWSTPNIFGNKPSTRALADSSLRQLDYLVYKLKEKGIYVFLDLLVHRDFTEADGIVNRPPDLGGKQIGFFSKDIIALQKEFATQLYNHVNQFTKIAYKDEPAIVATEFINEATIFTHFTGDILTPAYRSELQALWDSSQNKEKTLAVFGVDWSNDRAKLKLASVDGDIKESVEFLSGLEISYYKEMHKYLRELGVKYPLAGSNMPLPLLSSLKDNSLMDFTCNNEYWDHPQVWKIGDDWNRILEAPFHNRSQLKNAGSNLVQRKSYFKVEGKPYIITEWNHCYPNEQVLEGVPLMAAYGALQGWNGMLQFDFNHHILGRDRIRNYTLSVQPEMVAQWVMAAPLFLRGDVKTAPSMFVESISDEQVASVPSYSDFLDREYHLPFITRVAKNFEGKANSDLAKYASFFNRDSGIIRSETGELLYNTKTGYFSVNAPRVQGAAGFIGAVPLDFPLFSCTVSNRHASVFAVSADTSALTSTKHFYLVVTGPAKMKGQQYDATRNLLVNPGEGEMLVQKVEGTLTFKKTGGKKMEIYPLALDGKKGKALKLKKVKGAAGEMSFKDSKTLVYEVVVK